MQNGILRYFKRMKDNGTTEVVAKGNLVNTGGAFTNRRASFTPPYDHTLDNAEGAKIAVMNRAGVH